MYEWYDKEGLTVFWKKYRDNEQVKKAIQMLEGAERNKQIQQTMKQLQQQISERTKEVLHLREELEAARDGQKEAASSRKQLRQMQQEVARLKQQLQEAEQTTGQPQEVEDLEEMSADQQREAQEQARGVLRSALETFQDLETRVAQTEAEDAPNPMEVGSTVWVRRAGGQNLNRRNAPGLHSQVLDSLPIGMRLTLLEGPQPADNYTWWRVRASDGREGWVAGEELVTQPE